MRYSKKPCTHAKTASKSLFVVTPLKDKPGRGDTTSLSTSLQRGVGDRSSELVRIMLINLAYHSLGLSGGLSLGVVIWTQQKQEIQQ